MLINITISNSKYGKLMPEEDSVISEQDFFAVADGITRDPKLPRGFISSKIEDILYYYPRPSGAKIVADFFTKNFIKLSKNTDDIKSIASKGNKIIADYNKKKIKKVNFLENDYFGCVASVGFIRNNILHYGVIGDCGIVVINPKGEVKFESKNGMKDFITYENKHLKSKDFDWHLQSYRCLIRSQYRNKKKYHKGKLITYGAFTGEKNALDFFITGKKKVNKGDYVIFYSDGFKETIYSSKFLKLLRKPSIRLKQEIIKLSLQLAKEDYGKYGRERSLIIKKI